MGQAVCHLTCSVLFHQQQGVGAPAGVCCPILKRKSPRDQALSVCPSPSTLRCPLDASLMEQGKGKSQVLPADQNKTLSLSPGWVCQHLLQAWGGSQRMPTSRGLCAGGAPCADRSS